ncbi:DNA replication complex GINS protein psf3 [Venustampulla echinocandica]|uniref:DNA replication complex GINS protein PSF3 n=1 Tax=Venustampulla echinocandica TaxID=2656787 RepID=A0A370U048_9HELO|nr:DNA replication complex GINS protein psf3 [Venustampulla echinocandica]RDL41143.1 DNA replication complex GINS protein psf3 [Venustampulla echinocandica]
MSYYDIDAILTDAQKVPCTFELDVPSLGYLDNNAGHTLRSGTRVDLPLWLAEMLAVSAPSSSKSLVTLDIPPSLAPRVMNALKADPKSVDLRALAQHFYGLGARILELFEEEEICDVLMEGWRTRAAEISDHASNAGQGQRGGGGGVGSDGVEFLRGLDEAERGLFRVQHDSSKAIRVWMGETKKG